MLSKPRLNLFDSIKLKWKRWQFHNAHVQISFVISCVCQLTPSIVNNVWRPGFVVIAICWKCCDMTSLMTWWAITPLSFLSQDRQPQTSMNTQIITTDHIMGVDLFAPISESWCSVGQTLLHPKTIHPPYLRQYDLGSYRSFQFWILL
jgi:hypothetical protein